MIFSKAQALELEALVDPQVEEALIKLFDFILTNRTDNLKDLELSDSKVRAYLGQVALLTDLKQYKQRLKDAING